MYNEVFNLNLRIDEILYGRHRGRVPAPDELVEG